MKMSKVRKSFIETCGNPMFGIRPIIITISFYTKKELHQRKLPHWTRLNDKK